VYHRALVRTRGDADAQCPAAHLRGQREVSRRTAAQQAP
jgi:hypothetical protein